MCTRICIEKKLVAEGIYIEEDHEGGRHLIERLSLLSVAQTQCDDLQGQSLHVREAPLALALSRCRAYTTQLCFPGMRRFPVINSNHHMLHTWHVSHPPDVRV